MSTNRPHVSVDSCDSLRHVIHIVLVLLAIWNFFVLAPGVFAQESGDNPVTWDVVRWQQWRDIQITNMLTPTFITNGQTLISRQAVITNAAAAYVVLESVAQKDPSFLSNSEKMSVLSNFLAFTKAQHWMAVTDDSTNLTHSLGLNISDTDYWGYVSNQVEFPPLLESQQFLQTMFQRKYKAAYDMIEHVNLSLPDTNKWIVLPFRAGFIQSVDKTTYGRMLILIPNDRGRDGAIRDKWILFAIATPELAPAIEIKSVSMFTVRKDPANSGKTKTYYGDFLRNRDNTSGNISINSTFLIKPTPSKNCYDCHKPSVLPIFPAAEYDFDSAGNLIEKSVGVGQTLDLVNNRIEDYGLPDFGVQDTSAYGPSLGPDAAPPSAEFIKYASEDSSLSDQSVRNIQRAMNCAECHDDFAKINYLQAVRSDRDVKAFVGKRGMVQTFIENGWMPPDRNLTSQERTALWKCLMNQYLNLKTIDGLFVSWLKNNVPSLLPQPAALPGTHNPRLAAYLARHSRSQMLPEAAVIRDLQEERVRARTQDAIPVHGF